MIALAVPWNRFHLGSALWALLRLSFLRVQVGGRCEAWLSCVASEQTGREGGFSPNNRQPSDPQHPQLQKFSNRKLHPWIMVVWTGCTDMFTGTPPLVRAALNLQVLDLMRNADYEVGSRGIRKTTGPGQHPINRRGLFVSRGVSSSSSSNGPSSFSMVLRVISSAARIPLPMENNRKRARARPPDVETTGMPVSISATRSCFLRV